MLKKLLITLIILVSIWTANCFANGSYDWEWSLSKSLIEGCIDPEWRNLVTWSMKIKGEFKTKMESWIDTIRDVLWVFAVFAIIYGSFTLVTSIWEEDKVKKWKDIIKWRIIWFLWIISAWALIKIILWVFIV